MPETGLDTAGYLRTEMKHNQLQFCSATDGTDTSSKSSVTLLSYPPSLSPDRDLTPERTEPCYAGWRLLGQIGETAPVSSLSKISLRPIEDILLSIPPSSLQLFSFCFGGSLLTHMEILWEVYIQLTSQELSSPALPLPSKYSVLLEAEAQLFAGTVMTDGIYAPTTS